MPLNYNSLQASPPLFGHVAQDWRAWSKIIGLLYLVTNRGWCASLCSENFYLCVMLYFSSFSYLVLFWECIQLELGNYSTDTKDKSQKTAVHWTVCRVEPYKQQFFIKELVEGCWQLQSKASTVITGDYRLARLIFQREITKYATSHEITVQNRVPIIIGAYGRIISISRNWYDPRSCTARAKDA